MFTLITGKKDFDILVSSTNWHSAYLKEMHFGSSQFQERRFETDYLAYGGATMCGSTSLVRLLIALPEDSYALELILLDVADFSCTPGYCLEVEKTAVIQRRRLEVDLGVVSARCACMGYRKLEVSAVGAGQFYTKENLFDNNEKLLAPYDVDWQIVLDESFKIDN